MVGAAIMLAIVLVSLEKQIEPTRTRLDLLVRLEEVTSDTERRIEERILARILAPQDIGKELRRILTTALENDSGMDSDVVATLRQLADSNPPNSADMLAELARVRATLAHEALAGHQALAQLYEETHSRLLFALVLAVGLGGIATFVALRWRKRVLTPLGALARRMSLLERGCPPRLSTSSNQHALQPLFVSCDRIAARIKALEKSPDRTAATDSKRSR